MVIGFICSFAILSFNDFFLSICNLKGVSGTLITRPNATITTLIGQIVQLECLTNLTIPVNWKFKSSEASSTSSIPIYEGGTVALDIIDRMNVKTKVMGEYTLIIYHTILNDSGTYTCVDNSGFGPDEAETELLVVGRLFSHRLLVNN